MTPTPQTEAALSHDQREALLDAQRKANEGRPRNFKEDALEEKLVRVEPDDTGPTSTQTFDPAADREPRDGPSGTATPEAAPGEPVSGRA